MGEIKKILYIRSKEDYYGYEILFNIIILCFLSFLSLQDLQLRVSAHVFTLLWISINTCQLFSLFSRHNCDFIFCECPKSNRSVFRLFLLTCILENLIFAVFMFGQFIFAMHANPLYTMLFTAIHFSYAIAIGIFAGTVFRQLRGLIPIVLFYIWCIYKGGWWTANETTRFWSPTIQLYNVNIINFTNTAALVALIIVFLLVSRVIFNKGKANNCLKIAGITCLYAFIYLGLILGELSYNKKIENSTFNEITATHRPAEYIGISENNAIILAEALEDIEEELIKLKIINKEADKYQFKRYYVSGLYFLYNTRPVPVQNEDGVVYVNIFSDAMINFKEYEIVRDILNRMYDQLIFEESDNNYTYQIREGCREHILKAIVLNNPDIFSKDLVDWFDKAIQKRNQSLVIQNNFLKKIAGNMYDQYPKELAELYAIIENESPENNDEVIKIFEENFPELLKEDKIQQILNSDLRGK